MPEFFNSFVMTFLPLFIVIDVLGSLLYVVKAGEGLSRREQRRMAHIAVGTATVVGLSFLFFGQLILKAMNISEGPFIIAGGVILLVLSVSEILGIETIEIEKVALTAVVPLGTPLLSGPATITTLLLLSSLYPLYIVLISFMLNLLIAWGIYFGKHTIIKITGHGGLKAISNVFNLLLAAIAVSMVLEGLALAGILP